MAPTDEYGQVGSTAASHFWEQHNGDSLNHRTIRVSIGSQARHTEHAHSQTAVKTGDNVQQYYWDIDEDRLCWKTQAGNFEALRSDLAPQAPQLRGTLEGRTTPRNRPRRGDWWQTQDTGNATSCALPTVRTDYIQDWRAPEEIVQKNVERKQHPIHKPWDLET